MNHFDANSTPMFPSPSIESSRPCDTHVSLWQRQETSLRLPPRWRLAASVAGAILVVGVGMIAQLMRLQGPKVGGFASADEQIETKMQRDSELWLKDVLIAQHLLEAASDEQMNAVPMHDVNLAATPTPEMRGDAIKSGADDPARKHSLAATPGLLQNRHRNAAKQDFDFTSLFGSQTRFARAAKHASGVKRKEAVFPRVRDVRGLILEARLVDEVASDPAGAPIIALLTQEATLGQTRLPRGTELHGTVQGTGAEGSRVFVTFNFARNHSGAVLELSGDARDRNGRYGIPGRKIVTHKAVSSIGLASATRAMQAAGHQLAGSAGTILGAGIGGLVDSGGEKLRRVDSDEFVVIAPPQTRISVYLQSVNAEK